MVTEWNETILAAEKLKIYAEAVSDWQNVHFCAILRNALTCLYGNTTSQFFKLEPPTLAEYFI